MPLNIRTARVGDKFRLNKEPAIFTVHSVSTESPLPDGRHLGASSWPGGPNVIINGNTPNIEWIEPTHTNAEQIQALYDEAAGYAELRRLRLKQSLASIIAGSLVFVVLRWVNAMIIDAVAVAAPFEVPKLTMLLLDCVFWAVPLALMFLGIYALFEAFRLRLKLENLDEKMRRLDPQARFMTPNAEALSRSFRLWLDKRRDEKRQRQT
jgi:hypothetical protein